MYTTVPTPSISINILNNQTVGQSLTLEGTVTTVRGITSRVDIVWSSNGSILQLTEGFNHTSTLNNAVIYTDIYTIPQLSTTDDGRIIECDTIINAVSTVAASGSVTLNVTVPFINITTLPFGSIQGAMVGSPQDIWVTVNTVDGVELSSVMISWMGPGGETITNDSRVTISPTTSSGNTYTSTLQFTYLMEGDEGMYTCNVLILETSASNFIDVQTLTIPAPSVEIITLNNQTVGQSLTLESTITTVRGITSRMDIVWSSNGVELKRINNTNISLTVNDSELYESIFNIPLLSTSDDGRIFQCEMIIKTASSIIVTTNNITLDVTTPTPTITTLPSGPIQGAMVGSPQDIQCIVSTVSGVELSSVMISWMGPGGESIANDSRVTISPTTSSGTNYTSSLQFTYLMEGDEGMYTCNVMILETIATITIEIFELNVPTPDTINIAVMRTQTVGQPLILECSYTTVKGITSRVDIVWSSNGLELKRIEGVNASSSSECLDTYIVIYDVMQLNTSDDDRVFQCQAILNSNPPLLAIDNVTLNVTVPIPTITKIPSGSIQGAMVGSPQDIQVVVSTVDGVKLSSVLISWIGPGGKSITNDSRVTICPTTSSGSNYTSSLQFTYLMEGDEGIYTFNVMILDTSISKFIQLDNVTVPNSTNVTVTAPSTQIVGQSLILECSVTTVRGITSRVDIEWSTGNMMLQRTEGVSIISIASDTVEYKNIYNISPVSTLDDGRVYQCTGIINTTPQLMATDSITLDVTVPSPIVVISPSGPIQGALVGSPQAIECTVNTVSGVELSSVTMNWLGPDGNIITNSSRIIVNQITSFGQNYTRDLRFIHLVEEDVGTYTCEVMILNIQQTRAVELEDLSFSNSTSVKVTTLGEQIVGQALKLECVMLTPRGINNRVDIVWTRDGVEVERINDVSSNFSSPEVVVYTNIYTIPLLGTIDDDVVYECEVIINSSTPLRMKDNITLDVKVPAPAITISPSGPIQGAMVGSPQDIQVIVSTVNGVEFSSVMISWTGPGGVSITNDSRVTVSPTTSSGNNYTSSLQFTYLMEGDEGMYAITVTILDAVEVQTIVIDPLTIPIPSINIIFLSNQIVGQPLTLESTVTIVRGITSRVDIVWSSNGSTLKTTEGLNHISTSNNAVIYTDVYTIPQLSTADEGRIIQCEIVINDTLSVLASDTVTLNVTVPYINITTLPSGPIQGAMVGSPQDIQVIVNTVDGVELSSVMISWMGPGGETITNDSRVTISPITSSGNNYASSLQFTYLMEGDEGMYTFNVMILEINRSQSVELENLIVPPPYNISVISQNSQIIGQPLLLQCILITVRGITSSVDIVWSRDSVKLRTERNISINFTTSLFASYTSTYFISQLTALDDGTIYSCEAMINTSPLIAANDSIKLDVIVSPPKITILPPGPIQGAMVGSPQDIQCIVSTVDVVELSSVIISWMGPGGQSITNDSRVTVSPTTSSGKNYTTSLHFTYLMQGDEGIYTISVRILETTISETFELKPLIIPVPNQVYVTAPATQKVGQSLVLMGSIIAVRGITSRVDMVWSSNGFELETIEANISSITNDSVEYTAYYTIVQLNDTEDDRVYQCKVVINANPPVTASNNITLHATIPSPSVTVNMLSIPTVGQPLSLECIMTTVRGITSTIDIIWSRDGVEVKRTTGASITFSSGSSIVYRDFYNISLVTTNEEEKVYRCRGVINATPSLTAENNISLDLVVPNPIITIMPDNPIFGAMVGSPQDIQVIVSTVDGVELSSVMISWMGPGGESITNDSRVTISPTTSSGNNYASCLQFTYLMEGDEGLYTCNVMILETFVSSTREMMLNVPNPIVKINAPDSQIVGEPLTLECNVTTVRGITSRVDIVWSSNGFELKRIEGMHSSVGNNNLAMYMDSYTILPLSTDDEGRSYRCEVIINQFVVIAINDSITLDVTVPAISIDVSQSTEGSIVGLSHTLTCTVTAVVGVSPSLVKIDWIGNLESSQINVFDQNVTRSLDRLIFKRIVEFSPLLEQNIGEYMCSGRINGFGNVSKLESVIVMANDPSFSVNISPPLLTGNSGEDAIELSCTLLVTEDVISATYQFTWIKDDTPIDLSDNRIMVTNNNNTSSFVIKATDSNATLDNGIYRCEVTLTISGVNSFREASQISTVLFKAMIPPLEFVMIKAITAPYSAELSWVVLHIILDKETYTVKYSTDMSLQNSREVVIENDDEFSINQKFSVNITGLVPFTTYYYIIQANNSVGSIYTDIMNFTTNQTAPSAAPSNFQAINVTSTSITFTWDTLVDGANGIIKLYIITVKADDTVITVNVSGESTMETIHGLTLFTTYSCTLHVVTLSDGPLSDPITVTTAEQTPVAPVMKNLTAINSGSVRVEWNEPEVNYGIITMYTIYYTIENGPERSLIVPSNGQDVQSYVFSGMRPYQLITVTVSATNGGGTSEQSNEVTGRSLEAAPGIVEIIDLVSLSDAALTVTWSPPVQPNGIVTSYEVIYSVYEDNPENTTVPVTSNIYSFNITDLYAGVPYQITVVAYTSVGRGEENDPQIFFTQEQIPIKPPENVIFERNGSAINVSWDPLSLIEAKGFPTYTVTLRPLSSVGNQSNDDIISITTNQTSVMSDELDPYLEYILVVTVTTTIGEASTDEINVTISNVGRIPNGVSITNEENDDDDSIIILLILLILLVMLILLVIYVLCYLMYLRRQKMRKSYKLDNNSDEVEMQSSLQNSTILENPSARSTIGISNSLLPVQVFDSRGKCLL